MDRLPASWRQGSCFRFLLPEGWQVAEDGAFAVVRVPPDRLAIVALVGNAGLPLQLDPRQYAWERLSATGLQGLAFGAPRPAPPILGMPYAWEFDATYPFGGHACVGVARVSVAPAYDQCTMALTWAASVREQWPRYAAWLPQVAAGVEVTHPAAFGAAGMAAQNLASSMELGRRAQAAREASAAAWDAATAARGASEDRRHEAVRDALAGTERWDNPYDRRTLDLPAENAVYWVHATSGRIVGSPDAGFDPRDAHDAGWVPLRRTRS